MQWNQLVPLTCACLALTLAAAAEPPPALSRSPLPANPGQSQSRYDACLKKHFASPDQSEIDTNELLITVKATIDNCTNLIFVKISASTLDDESWDIRALTALPQSSPTPQKSPALDIDCQMIAELPIPRDNYDQLQKHARDFMELKISPTFDPTLWLHGGYYEISIYSVFNYAEYRFWGPGPAPLSGKVKLHPLEEWTLDLLKEMQLTCAR